MRLRLPNGAVLERVTATEAEGNAILRALQAEALAMQRRGELVPPPPPAELTLAGWGETWLDRRERLVAFPHKERSRWRCYVAGTALAAQPLSAIETADVVKWVAALDRRPGRRPSASTCALALALVRRALADARLEGLIKVNPARGVPLQRKVRPRERVALTPAELLAVVNCDAIPVRARCCYAFAALTGLRPGELWALRWGDLDTDGARPEVIVRRSHDRDTPKGGKVRAVPLVPAAVVTLATLRALEDFTAEAADLVFPTVTGRQRRPDDDHGWSSRRRRGVPCVGHRELAGVRSVVEFYGLRHTCASFLTMGELTGEPVEAVAVQRWMGHASITTTMRYAHLAPGYLHRVVAGVRGGKGAEAGTREQGSTETGRPPYRPPYEPSIRGTAHDVPRLETSTLEGTRTPDRRIRNAHENAAPQGVFVHSPPIRPPIETSAEGAPGPAQHAAWALLRAVDAGAPAADAARALAVATLAQEPPGSRRWRLALAVMEGGPLRTRRAVVLAGEVVGDGMLSEGGMLSEAVSPYGDVAEG